MRNKKPFRLLEKSEGDKSISPEFLSIMEKVCLFLPMSIPTKIMIIHFFQKICNVLDVNPNTIVRPNQKHTDCVEKVDSASEDLGTREIDGLITNKKDINLLLTFADCTPIILYDPVNKAIGNIHSGWRGTVQKIGKKATLKMMKEYGSKPEDIIACFGPAIGQCHFEVEEEVKNIFEMNLVNLQRNMK